MGKEGFLAMYAADLHGNTAQYTKIFRRMVNDSYDALILGGDLCPKGSFTGSINVQREFLISYLIPALKQLATKNNKKVYLMLGNDDWAGNIDLLEEHHGSLFNLLESGPFRLCTDFDVIGYPYVPITPFRIKDWEKWDLATQNPVELERRILLKGIVSRKKYYEDKIFNPENRHDSIENDMKELFLRTDPKKTIYVFHSPPYNTNLDMLYSREHVGSIALRMAIEKSQPRLTLHSHIHETVDVSGEFIDKIKNTLIAAPGNHNDKEEASVLSIRLPEIEIRRLVLR
ncbi:metallophosphoesterase [Candidatus Woesearchaeota archaeon]|nr:metallophosphoesterase [Candidatus Woesearchaeota archaeon]